MPVLKDQRIDARAKLVYVFLWSRTCGQPARIDLYESEIAMGIGADRRGVQRWLEHLAAADLIHVRRRQRLGRKPMYVIDVYSPNPGEAAESAARDNQLPLPFGDPDQRPEQCQVQRTQHAQRQVQRAHREPRHPPAEQAALDATSNVASNVTSNVATDVASNVARPPDAPQVVGPQADGPRLARAPTRTRFGTIEQENKSNLPKYQRTNRSIDTKESIDTNETIENQRARVKDPPTIGEATAEALALAAGQYLDATTADQQKQRLERHILAVVQQAERRIADLEPGQRIKRWLAGKAADLVIFHQVPLADLDRILADVGAMSAAGSLRRPAAFFHAKVQDLDLRHGVGLFNR